MKKLKLFLKSKITTDTIALVIFSICASGGLTVLYELLIIDMTKGQWLVFRVLYNILKFSGAYFCVKITDWMRLRILKTSQNRFHKAIADTISISIYQIPLYIMSGLIMGINIIQLLIVSSIYLVDNMILGWLYGVILDWTRKKLQNSTVY